MRYRAFVRRKQLEAVRKTAGLSQEDVAERVGVDRTTIGKWERNESTPRPNQRPAYAEALGVTLGELAAMLSSMPVAANEVPDWLSTYLAMEQSARRMYAHEDEVVFGLLQTPAYTEAIARAVGVAGVSDDYVAQNIDQRRYRQKRVTGGELALDVIQAETVLHVRLGGPAVMAEQLHAMADLAELDNVTVRILDFEAGQHAVRGLDTFTILEHPWGTPTIFVEGYGGGRFITDADEVTYFLEVYDQATRLALSPAESVDRIRTIARKWEARR